VKRFEVNSVARNSSDSLCAALRVMPQLQSISIGEPYRESLMRIPVTVVDAIAASCTQLLSLFVYAQVVGDAESALVNIARRNPILTQVKLRDVPVGVTNAVVYALAEHCAGLLVVEVSSAKLVTDASVIALARACPRIYFLELRHCTRLTDRSILALADHCPALRELNVGQSTLISTPALMQLQAACTRLHALTVSSASIPKEAVKVRWLEKTARRVWITRVDVPRPTWMGAMTSSVMRALFRRRSAASVAPIEGLDGVFV
jgi:hypothetical protein